jgi:hypothetical protein
MNKALRVVAGLLAIFVCLPIWLSLLYGILIRVDASDVMWLLYWVYVPISVLVTYIVRLIDEK